STADQRAAGSRSALPARSRSRARPARRCAREAAAGAAVRLAARGERQGRGEGARPDRLPADAAGQDRAEEEGRGQVKRAIRTHLGDFGALLGILAIALFVVGYIFVHQAARPRLPFESKPFQIEAAFNEAQAVVPGQGQSVRIAGVQVGLVSSVQIEDGQAIVDMNLDRRYRGYVRTDASAMLRPRTGVKDMFVELDPGSAPAPAMQQHGRILVAAT